MDDHLENKLFLLVSVREAERIILPSFCYHNNNQTTLEHICTYRNEQKNSVPEYNLIKAVTIIPGKYDTN